VLAVSKAWKTLENEEGYRRCQEIVEEAKSRVDETVCVFIVSLLLRADLTLFLVTIC